MEAYLLGFCHVKFHRTFRVNDFGNYIHLDANRDVHDSRGICSHQFSCNLWQVEKGNRRPRIKETMDILICVCLGYIILGGSNDTAYQINIRTC